jgi:hypothetical protein
MYLTWGPSIWAPPMVRTPLFSVILLYISQHCLLWSKNVPLSHWFSLEIRTKKLELRSYHSAQYSSNWSHDQNHRSTQGQVEPIAQKFSGDPDLTGISTRCNRSMPSCVALLALSPLQWRSLSPTSKNRLKIIYVLECVFHKNVSLKYTSVVRTHTRSSFRQPFSQDDFPFFDR